MNINAPCSRISVVSSVERFSIVLSRSYPNNENYNGWYNGKLTFISLSRISQENIPGLSRFNSSILASTSGVATRGLLPPITPGRMDPVSWYRFRIFETQPWETRSCLEITQGRTPAAAISTIFRRIWLGRGRPLIKTPPSWFIRPCPARNDPCVDKIRRSIRETVK